MPTHYKGTPEQVRALNVFIKLTRAAESINARLFRCERLGDLTASQFGVLESLYHLGPMSQSDVAAKLLKSGGNMTLVINNLEKRGLVRRQRDQEDRRVVNVSLTEAGQALIERLLPGHVDAIVQEMRVLTAEEQEVLGRLCRKVGKQERD